MKQKYGDGLHLIILCASFHVTGFWWSKTEGKVESWGGGGGLSIPEQRPGSQGGVLEFWILAHKQSWGFCGHDGYLQHPISPYDVCVESNLQWAYHPISPYDMTYVRPHEPFTLACITHYLTSLTIKNFFFFFKSKTGHLHPFSALCLTSFSFFPKTPPSDRLVNTRAKDTKNIVTLFSFRRLIHQIQSPFLLVYDKSSAGMICGRGWGGGRFFLSRW